MYEQYFQWVAPAALCLPRLTGALLLAPFMRVEVIGGKRIRNGVILVAGIFVYPIASTQVDATISLNLLLVLTAKEVFVGLMMGAVPMAIFWGFQSIGAFIDNQRGATSGSSLDPLLGEQNSPLGVLFMQSSIAMLFVLGGFYYFMQTVYTSYLYWPIGGMYPEFNRELVNFMLVSILYALQICVLLAAPIIIVLVLTDICMGLIGRFAPNLDVFFLSMPIKSVIAVFILLLSWQLLVDFMSKEIFVVIGRIPLMFVALTPQGG